MWDYPEPTPSEKVAFDIYKYIEKVFQSKDKDDMEFRYRYGQHGCLDRVFYYIEHQYLSRFSHSRFSYGSEDKEV